MFFEPPLLCASGYQEVDPGNLQVHPGSSIHFTTVISHSQGTFPEKELWIVYQELVSILSYLGPPVTGQGCQFAMWLLIQL